MDRDRLKDIQTADLSDSQVNEDFVFWLKTKGPSYLFIIMIVIAAYMFFVKYKQGKIAHRAEAWIAYTEASAAGLPASHEDIAQSFSEIDSLYRLGLLSAADGYMKSVITGQEIGSTSEFTTIISDEDRTFYLEKADALYARVIENDSNLPEHTLLVVSGLNGRAAVAESNGLIENARSFYETVIARAGTQYPALAKQAEKRINSLDILVEPVILPSDAEVAARTNQALQRDPAPINSSLDELSLPTESGQ